MNRRLFLSSSVAAALAAQTAEQQEPSIPFICPMDPDVRSAVPAKCPKCGMKLVAGIPDPREFAVRVVSTPRVLRPGSPAKLRIVAKDPKTGKPARLQLIHEKLLHLFILSSDLSWFAHVHPEHQPDGSFIIDTVLPHAGEYRLLCDFYPDAATPQMIGKTIYVAGQPPVPKPLQPDLEPKRGENLTVSLRLEPAEPLAGLKTMMFFRLDPGDHLEPYLGAWGHMLCASSDLIDTIHTHPAWEDRSDTVQFNLIFPRPGLHRVWVQFQRAGVLNTVAFTIPVNAV